MADGMWTALVLVAVLVVAGMVYQWYMDPERAARAAIAKRLAEAKAAEKGRRRTGASTRHGDGASAVPAGPDVEADEDTPAPKVAPKPKAPAPLPAGPKPAPKPAHPAFKAALKGHTDAITAIAMSLDGKYIASAAKDRSLRVWSLKTLEDSNVRYARVNTEFDHITAIVFSPDSHNILYALADAKSLQVLKRTKKPDGATAWVPAVTFAKQHAAAIHTVAIASSGRFIVSASADSTLNLWDLKGHVLESTSTAPAVILCARVSPDASQVAVATSVGDVRLFSVVTDKVQGNVERLARAFEIRGHRNGVVVALDFLWNSRRLGTVGKDRMWRIWTLDVRHREDPKVVQEGQLWFAPSCVGFSPDGKLLAAAGERTLWVYSVDLQAPVYTVDDAHTSAITGLVWSPDGSWVATASADRTIRLWHARPAAP